ncbi:MAG TPA: hypothetical protein VK901_02615 [Nitrospiraceae bacterium]|nr:hypothetical protein [Nitrospiraceae bacterium]
MRRLTVAAAAALCLMGASSLALAEEGTKYGDQIETGKLSQEPSVLGNKREPVRADDAMKREPVPDDAMKGEKVPPRTYSGEGARYGDQTEPTGKLSQEPSVLGSKRKPVRPNEPMKGKKTEHKEKTKTHKDSAKTAPAAPAPAL